MNKSKHYIESQEPLLSDFSRSIKNPLAKKLLVDNSAGAKLANILFLSGLITGIVIGMALYPSITDLANRVIETDTSLGSESELVGEMQQCVINSKLGCADRVICTGISDYNGSTKADQLMAQHKAEAFALNQAFNFFKRTKATDAVFLNSFIANYSVVGSVTDLNNHIISVAIADNCK